MVSNIKPLAVKRLDKALHPDISGPWAFVEMPYSELLRFYRSATTDPDAEGHRLGFDTRSTDRLVEMVNNWQHRDGFYGGTTEDMLRYVDGGYNVGQLRGSFLPGVLRTRDGDAQRGRWMWDDTGDEIDVTMALSGDPTCFRSYRMAPTLGGLNVVALMAFSSTTDFDIIAQYGAWIARLLATCQTAGISPSLIIDQYGHHISTAEPNCLIRIRVKQEHDALDWRRYSALFSPCGFRHLCFGAMCRATGPKHLLAGSTASNLGTPVSPYSEWTLSWEPTTRTVTVAGPRTPRSFDSDSLTRQLIASGALNPEHAEVYA